MKLTLICLTSLLILSQAVNLRRNENQKELGQVFLQLDQKAKDELFSAFPMLMQMTGPLDDIYDFINDIELNLRSEQREADALYATENERCTQEVAKRESNVAAGTKALQHETSRRAMCQTQVSNGQTSLSNLINNGEALVNQRASTESLRATQIEAFNQRVMDLADFQNQCDTARMYVAAMGYVPIIVDDMRDDAFIEETAPVSFVELHTNLKKSSLELVKSAISNNLLKASGPVIKQMAIFLRKAKQNEGEETRGADQAMLAELDDTILELKAQSQAESDAAVAQAIVDSNTFDSNMAQIDANEVQNNLDIETTENLITSGEECVEQATTFIIDLDGEEGFSEGRISRQQRILDNAQLMCQAFTDEYLHVTQTRDNQRELLEALRTELYLRLDQIYGAARQRANEEEAEWDELVSA